MTLVVAGVLRRRSGDRVEVLAARRRRPATLAGRWEFPGGKVEPGERPVDALVRELTEELGCTASVGAELVAAQGFWPIDEKLRMRAWWCDLVGGEPSAGADHDELRWVGPRDLRGLDWLPADVALAEMVARSLVD